MLLLAALLQTTPVLADIRQRTPAEAAAIVLAGKDHAPIVAIDYPLPYHLQAPGVTHVQLVERPTAIPRGCSRQRWVATFQDVTGKQIEASPLRNVYAQQEVALALRGQCPFGRYAHVNPGLSIPEAIEALHHINTIRAGHLGAPEACEDQTSLQLCASVRNIPRELSALSPWHVDRSKGLITVTLGAPGQIVTQVRYAPADPKRYTIARYVPMP